MSRWTLTAVLASALALAACGESSDDPAEAPVPPAPIGDAAPTPPAPVAAPAPAIEPARAPIPPAPIPEPAAAVAPPADAVAAPAAPEPAPTPAAALASPAPVAAPAQAPDDAPLLALIAAADPAAGEALAAQCAICHTFATGEGTRVGPNLYDIVGAPVARTAGFTYSAALLGLAATGGTWTFAALDAFIANPAEAAPGTRMGFSGMPDPQDRANVLAWLRTLSERPVPVGGPLDDARAAAVAAGLVPIAFDGVQLQAGRDFFNQYCARCHGTNLRGMTDMREFGEATGLVGDRFLGHWLGRPVSELYALMANDTREDYHGGFTPERYANLIAYLAERNGMVAGDVPLPTDATALGAIGFFK